jgi:electron transport complex protein RnfG
MIKDILRLGIILLLISALATGILAWVNAQTIQVINDRKIKEAADTRQAMMPDAKTFEEKKSAEDTTFVYYIARNDKGEVIGYNFVAAKRGYSSIIKTMVALDKDYKITSLQVIDQNETPGLGTHCLDKDFPAKFIGMNETTLKVDKDGGQIKSITGATITTRAITNSLRDAILMVKEDLALLKEAAGKKDEAGKPVDPKALKAAKIRQQMMPAAKNFVEYKAKADTNFVYYIAKDDKDQTVGYILYGSQKGYCSVIKTAACLDNELNIVKVKVLKQDETPGLGSLCMDDEFISQFKGKGLNSLKIDKDGGPIVAVTGATITSRAITKSLNNAVLKLKTDLAAVTGSVK